MSRQNSKPRKKKTTAEQKFDVAVLIVLAIIELFPIALVILNSFKTHQQILKSPFSLPTSLSLDNFIKTWQLGEFNQAFMNSIKLSATSIVVAVLLSSCIGYVLARRKIKQWKLVTIYFMAATTVPLQLFLLPLYSLFVKTGLLGNVYAVGVAIAVWQLPLPIFLMRTYVLKVPLELEEAAQMDGASSFGVFSKVVLPIISPGLVTVSIIVGLASWNEYLLTSTLLQGEANFTATLRYANLNSSFSVDYAIVMAGAVIMVVPMIIMFLMLQKRFIEGMVGGAVKG